MTLYTQKIRKYEILPLYIVEDHNDVVPFIHRAIGSRHLPEKDLVFIHFDSHPDLLIPGELQADDVYNKDKLYSETSIENWILPMVYAGHISDIVWLKPPWCTQIEDKTLKFFVGKCASSGKIRTSCTENYFVSEVLYRSSEELVDKKSVTLTVITVLPSDWNQLHHIENTDSNGNSAQKETADNAMLPNGDSCDVISQKESSIELNEGATNYQDQREGEPPKKKFCQAAENTCANDESSKGAISEQCLNLLEKTFTEFKDRYFILDIDLDFFSTKNPFKEMYTDSQYQLLKTLYTFDKPDDNSDKAIKTCVENREKQLSYLKKVFSEIHENPHHKISHDRHETIEALVSDLSSCGNPIDYELLHEAGCTCDDTELPHHVSSQGQITLLIEAVQEVLSHLHKPTVITLARSSNDDYCPPDQVDDIQEQVLEMLQSLYLHINMSAHYTSVQ